MSGLSITSFLQPLNSYKSANNANIERSDTKAETEKSSAFTLDLSDAAKEMMSSKATTAGGMESNLKDKIQSVQDKLLRKLLSHNINFNDQNIEFESDESGNIRVKGDHPDKDAIESLINGDKEFANELKTMLRDSSMLAQTKLNQKYNISIESLEKEDKDDEEKKLAMANKLIDFAKQIDAVSGGFNLNKGVLSASALNLVSSMSFGV